MYCFMNHFSFEYHRSGISNDEIKTTLEDLVKLLKLFKENEINLVFNYMFSSVKVNGMELKKHILTQLEQKSRTFLLKKLDSSKPFCANIYDDYQDDEFIMSNCKDRIEKIDILETFLACAMYLKAPIITADKFCAKGHFFNTEIEIECNEGKISQLKNYKLSEYNNLLSSLNAQKFTNIKDWDTYINFINTTFQKVKVTNECKEYFKIYSFDSPQGKCIKNEIERFEIFVKDRADQAISNINYKELDKNINEESITKQRKRKSKLISKDKNGNTMVMSWHTRVNDDFRLYFYFEDGLIYFTLFCPKISDS